MLGLPLSYEYSEAFSDLGVAARDEELRRGEPDRNALGIPAVWSGAFADVYKVHSPQTGNTWAVKCFTREVRGRAQRYRQIANHLAQARLPFMVDFQYLDHGLRIRGRWLPVLKMRWVEGLALHQFVAEHLEQPQSLKPLLELWSWMAARLRESGTAHGDLQHGNVLLVPGKGGAFKLRLIDYDGMYAPALAGLGAIESGHPSYQHPQRLREPMFSPEIDRFSHLVIYTAICCLLVGRRELWERFHNGENLLFTQEDYQRPEESEAFRTCWELPDDDARSLVGRLILACRTPMEEVPLLEQVVVRGRAIPLSNDEEHQVNLILGIARSGGAFGKRVSAQPESETKPIALPSDPVPYTGPRHDQQNPALPPMARQRLDIGSKPGRIPYSHWISIQNPACIVLLIDQSASMCKPFDLASGRTKAEQCAEIANRFIETVVYRALVGETCRDTFHVGVVGYGRRVAGALGGSLAAQGLVPISRIADSPLRVETRKRIEVDETGEPVELSLLSPVWIEPLAEGPAPMCEALLQAKSMVEAFVQANPASFPPIVVNVGSGIATDGTPEPPASDLRDVSSEDGNVLLFNVELSDLRQSPIEFPLAESELPNDMLSQALFRMSSILPDSIWSNSPGFDRPFREGVRKGSRCYALNSDLGVVHEIVSLRTGTSPSIARW